MSAYDTALEWASEAGTGSWKTWRDVCEALDLPSNMAARKLAALGHIEFDWVDNRFAAAPPAAVLTMHSSGCLLLTGARRRDLRARLEEIDSEGEYDIDLRDPVSQEGGPQTWLIEAEIDEAQRFCAEVGFVFELDSGRRMLEALPEASLEACTEEGRPDPRFPRKWIDPQSGPRTNIDAGRDGLWWVEEHRRDAAFIRREGDWHRVRIREYGPYLAYPDRSFLTYRSAVAVLSVDDQAPLPPVIARAATLQSGRLAKREGASRHAYMNIDEPLAKLAERKLAAKVRWE